MVVDEDVKKPTQTNKIYLWQNVSTSCTGNSSSGTAAAAVVVVVVVVAVELVVVVVAVGPKILFAVHRSIRLRVPRVRRANGIILTISISHFYFYCKFVQTTENV